PPTLFPYTTLFRSNLANIQQFKKRATAGDVRNALAIDQYHVLGRLGAADEQTGQTAATAALGHLHAWRAGNQVQYRIRLETLDIRSGKHGGGHRRVAACLRRTVSRYDRFTQLVGIGGRLGKRWRQGYGQGQGGKLHQEIPQKIDPFEEGRVTSAEYGDSA